jgi:hypothetical protein
MVFADRTAANGSRMKNIRIVLADGLRPGDTLNRRNFLPEVVQHGIGERMPVMRSALHLATADDVDACNLLL